MEHADECEEGDGEHADGLHGNQPPQTINIKIRQAENASRDKPVVPKKKDNGEREGKGR